MNEYFKIKNSENYCIIVNVIYFKFLILYDEVYFKVIVILYVRILFVIF